MALLMGKGDLYPFSDYLKNYEEKSKGAVKPEIFNLISSQPLFFYQPRSRASTFEKASAASAYICPSQSA